MNRNIKLTIAYDGSEFCGWQRQENGRSIQGVIEQALEKMHGKAVNLTGSGRTDAGVHAVGQAANFYTDIDSIPADRFTPALNSLLEHDVRILESSEVDSNFHARFSAKARTYRYQFLYHAGANFGYNPPLPHENRCNITLQRFPRLDLLNAYGRIILGETDCTIFAGAGDTSKSKNRFIYSSHFFIENGRLIFEICANAFLRNMVRSVAGTFLHYEEKDTSPDELGRIITSGQRSLAGTSLPPHGLFLWKVEY
ncbi:MAG: tRNA pseudouridine(38-40) synthase TruA [Treponema sp.]|jgi:tRNA pseudouridine38-40 synthase|nr:tRNA pseudouridine(38-40) synthase TruA [Treponema sp.]